LGARAEIVGTVGRLWRYPVKSMLGEEVDSADVVWSGFFGNRCYALVDPETTKLVSAKNPLKWGRAFECGSRLLSDAEAKEARRPRGQPPVRIVLPAGESYDISEDNYGPAEKALSGLFGRQVRFTAARSEPRVLTYEQYHPVIQEDPQRGKTTDLIRPVTSQAGTFTDKAAVHIVTGATLKSLEELHPSGNFDPLRFRPNIFVDTGEAEGFVEKEWVGRNMAVGDEVELEVFAECGRCVMTTLRQPAIADDTGILSTVMRYNKGKTGVFASVIKGGKVAKGDELVLL
jgi:uncharacterized protein YcbX